MKTHRVLLVAVIIICFISVVEKAALADGPVAGPAVIVSGPSPFEQACDGGPSNGFTNYHNYEVEPYVAVNPTNPRNIVVAWQQDRWSWGGSNGSVIAVTHDGGTTWRRVVAQGSGNCSGGAMQRSADDWLTFARNGELYHSALAFNADYSNSGILVSKSMDGGDTWSLPVAVHTSYGPDAVDDKDSVTADPYDSRYVYAVWSQTVTASDSSSQKVTSWFARTTDSGATWERARKIFDPGEYGTAIGHQIVVLPNGHLLNAFTLISEDGTASIALMRSVNKGRTWSKPAIIETLSPAYVSDPAGTFVISGSNMIDIAVDKRNGNVYIVWEEGRFSGYAVEGIAFMKSIDGGRTWSDPVQVNKVTSTSAFTPSVAVSHDGTVAVTYYDFRNYAPESGILATDHWIVVSRDGGKTWKESHVGGSFDMRSAPEPGAWWYFLGDYVGLASAGNSFVSAFTMANDGNLLNPTDIFVATIHKKEKDDEETR